MKRDNYAGLWILTDNEMLRYSIYADEAAKRFKKKGATALSKEAKDTAKEIDNILEETEYYSILESRLSQLEITA